MRKAVMETDTKTKVPKERHNLVMSPRVWHVLSELKKIRSESISTLLENMVLQYIESENFDSVYFKVMSSPYCDKAESDKISKALDSLTPEDMEIAEEHSLVKF